MKDKLILKDYFSYDDKESILAQMQAHSKEWGAIPFFAFTFKRWLFPPEAWERQLISSA